VNANKTEFLKFSHRELFRRSIFTDRPGIAHVHLLFILVIIDDYIRNCSQLECHEKSTKDQQVLVKRSQMTSARLLACNMLSRKCIRWRGEREKKTFVDRTSLFLSSTIRMTTVHPNANDEVSTYHSSRSRYKSWNHTSSLTRDSFKIEANSKV